MHRATKNVDTINSLFFSLTYSRLHFSPSLFFLALFFTHISISFRSLSYPFCYLPFACVRKEKHTEKEREKNTPHHYNLVATTAFAAHSTDWGVATDGSHFNFDYCRIRKKKFSGKYAITSIKQKKKNKIQLEYVNIVSCCVVFIFF